MSSSDRDRNRSGRGQQGPQSSADKPPNSRLFIICSKHQTESDLKDYFGQFGEVEDVFLVKDKVTREPKGVAYVKFSKFSQAARAMEESDGKRVMNMSKPIKVIIANSRGSHSSKDIDEKTELTRLFVVVPSSYDDDELFKKFDEYGEIDHVTIITDKKTGANKGFGYVKFRRVSGAANALENCDRSFKAVMAEPRRSEKRSRDDVFERDYSRSSSDHDRLDYGRPDYMRYDHVRKDYGRGSDGGRASDYGRFSHNRVESDYPMRGEYTSPTALPRATAPQVGNFEVDGMFFPQGPALPANLSPRLVADIVGPVTETQVKGLFSIIPGMEYCDYREEQVSWGYKGTAYVRYSVAAQAAYAKQKLDNFEYPPGCPMQVKFVEDNSSTTLTTGSVLGGFTPTAASQPPSCTVALPPLQPMADPDSPVEERLFVICTRPLPDPIICDVFRRFGNFISYKNVHGRNYGYAKFARKESAEICLNTLHGQTIAGEKLKVIVADPEPEERKRPRTT